MFEEIHKMWQNSLKWFPQLLIWGGEQHHLLMGKHLVPLTP